ncbi:MAG TPA: YezD family protein [Gemmatimonadales bacterium]|nr:YezD family protein [Gemmatimonadales bacterium]
MNGHALNEVGALDPALLRELAAALRGLQFGTIELVVHDARVVQLERRERVRFEPRGREQGRAG